MILDNEVMLRGVRKNDRTSANCMSNSVKQVVRKTTWKIVT